MEYIELDFTENPYKNLTNKIKRSADKLRKVIDNNSTFVTSGLCYC